MTKKYIKRAVFNCSFVFFIFKLFNITYTPKKVDNTGGGFGKMKMQKAFE